MNCCGFVTKLSLLCVLLCALPLQAKEWTVQMLNYSNSESMLFEPMVIQAQVGDRVTFVPAHSGHYAQSFITPDGTSRWQTDMDKTATITLQNEGIHIYYCPPHLMMGMVGMIQVGEATNLDKVAEKISRLKAKAHLKPQRVDLLIDNISHK